MKVFGSFSELVSLIFRKNSQAITLRPNQTTTYTGSRDIQTPEQDANSILTSRDSTDTLTNKSMSGASNTFTNIPLTTAVTGVLPTANGGTGQNSTATFPTSGVVVTEAGTQTLTNKTIDGDNNTLQDLALATLKTLLADADKVLRRDASGAVVSGNTIPNSSALVTTDSTQDLSNKELTAPLIDDYLDINEESAPSTPASGKVRVYAKTDKKLYKKDSTGLETSIGGSGAGEKNYVANPDESGNWVASGAGVTVATTTTAAELPEESKLSGIKLTGVSGTDYARYRFTIDDSDKSKKNKIQFALKSASGYATNDFKVEMYTNTASNYGGTYASLPIQTNSQIPKNDSGAVLQYAFDSDTSDYYELRITRTAGTSFIVFSGVIVGPGVVAQGAALSDEIRNDTLVTPFTGAFGTIAEQAYWYRRVGDMMEIRGFFTTGTTAADSPYVTLNNFTIDLNRVTASNRKWAVGEAWVISSAGGVNNFGSGDKIASVWIDEDENNRLYFGKSGGTNEFRADDANGWIPSGSSIAFRCMVPISQWTGQGTLNILQEDNLKSWQQFTIAIRGATTDPTFGTTTTNRAEWRRVGENMEVRWEFRQTTTGTAGSGAYFFDLSSIPGNYTVDTTKLPSFPQEANSVVGHLQIFYGSTIYSGYARLRSTNQQISFVVGNDATAFGEVASSFLGFNANPIHWSFQLSFPVTQFANSQNGLVGFSEATTTNLGLVRKPLTQSVQLSTANGFGSSGTRVRRFSTVVASSGSGLFTTDNDNSAVGCNITALKRCKVTIGYIDNTSGSGSFIGISKNASSTSTTVDALASSQVPGGFVFYGGTANQPGGTTWTGILEINDTLRPHSEGIAAGNNSRTFLFMFAEEII